MLVWNDVDKCNSFGENQSVSKKEKDFQEQMSLSIVRNNKSAPLPLTRWLKYVVFDLVYLSGGGSKQLLDKSLSKFSLPTEDAKVGDLTKYPLVVRRDLLTEVMKSGRQINKFDIVETQSVYSSDPLVRQEALEVFFDDILGRGEVCLHQLYHLNIINIILMSS